MEMETINLDDVGGILECPLHVSVLKNTIPHPIGAGFLVQKALILQGLFGVYDRMKRLVLNPQEFGRWYRTLETASG